MFLFFISQFSAAFRSPGHTSNDVIHIGTANPVCLYSMNPRTMSANFLDMYDIFPVTSGSFRPRIKIAPLAAPLDDSVVVHEEVVCRIDDHKCSEFSDTQIDCLNSFKNQLKCSFPSNIKFCQKVAHGMSSSLIQFFIFCQGLSF